LARLAGDSKSTERIPKLERRANACEKWAFTVRLRVRRIAQSSYPPRFRSLTLFQLSKIKERMTTQLEIFIFALWSRSILGPCRISSYGVEDQLSFPFPLEWIESFFVASTKRVLSMARNEHFHGSCSSGCLLDQLEQIALTVHKNLSPIQLERDKSETKK